MPYALAITMYPQGAGFLLAAIHLKQEPVLAAKCILPMNKFKAVSKGVEISS